MSRYIRGCWVFVSLWPSGYICSTLRMCDEWLYCVGITISCAGITKVTNSALLIEILKVKTASLHQTQRGDCGKRFGSYARET